MPFILLWGSLGALLLWCWVLPTIPQMFAGQNPVLMRGGGEVAPPRLRAMEWAPSPRWAICIGVVLVACTVSMLSGKIEFLYYDF